MRELNLLEIIGVKNRT